MAVDVQVAFPVETFTPYERPPDSVALWTAIPRGLVSFIVSAQLDAKAIGDQALLSIPGALPQNYGYVFNEIGWTIVQDVANDWRDRCNLNMQTWYRQASGPILLGMNANFSFGTQTVSLDNQTRALITSDRTGMPSKTPMVAPEGANFIQFNFNAWNGDTVNAGAVGVVDFYLSYWQFDLEQIRKYPINSPLPVQAR